MKCVYFMISLIERLDPVLLVKVGVCSSLTKLERSAEYQRTGRTEANGNLSILSKPGSCVVSLHCTALPLQSQMSATKDAVDPCDDDFAYLWTFTPACSQPVRSPFANGVLDGSCVVSSPLATGVCRASVSWTAVNRPSPMWMDFHVGNTLKMCDKNNSKECKWLSWFGLDWPMQGRT